jgi:hypothetical protein
MNRQQSPTITVKRPGARNELETRLHGRWLWLARIGWITLGVLSVIFVVAGFPLEFQYYQTIGNVCAPVLSSHLSRRGNSELWASPSVSLQGTCWRLNCSVNSAVRNACVTFSGQ